MENHTLFPKLIELIINNGIEALLPAKLPAFWLDTLRKLNDSKDDISTSILVFVVLLLLHHDAASRRIDELENNQDLLSTDPFETFGLCASMDNLATVFGLIDIYSTHLHLEDLRRHRTIKDIKPLTLENIFTPHFGAVVTFFDPHEERQELVGFMDEWDDAEDAVVEYPPPRMLH